MVNGEGIELQGDGIRVDACMEDGAADLARIVAECRRRHDDAVINDRGIRCECARRVRAYGAPAATDINSCKRETRVRVDDGACDPDLQSELCGKAWTRALSERPTPRTSVSTPVRATGSLAPAEVQRPLPHTPPMMAAATRRSPTITAATTTWEGADSIEPRFAPPPRCLPHSRWGSFEATIDAVVLGAVASDAMSTLREASNVTGMFQSTSCESGLERAYLTNAGSSAGCLAAAGPA